MNALRYERDQREPVAFIRERESELQGDEPGTCAMTVQELRQNNVPLVVTTVIARMKTDIRPHRNAPRYGLDHPTQDMAHASAMGQLAYYEALARQGVVRIITNKQILADHWAAWEFFAQQPEGTAPLPPLGTIITMEGADPIVEPSELGLWWQRGLRSLMLAHFQQSCYAYGTPSREHPKDEGLTDKGRSLLKEMNAFRMPLDLTHLCDRSFAEAVDAYEGPIYSSHSNARALADWARQLTDAQIKTITDRGGVLGLSFHIWMLFYRASHDIERKEVSLGTVADHIDHICQLTGVAEHVAIGSDLDGGFGVEDCPNDLDTAADMHRLSSILSDRGYTDDQIDLICFGNWLRYWGQVLPV